VNAGILHAPFIPRILVMIDDVLDVRLAVQRDPFLLARWPDDTRASAKYTSPRRSERWNRASRSPLPEEAKVAKLANMAKLAKVAMAVRGRRD
jgi:hypothetical protein